MTSVSEQIGHPDDVERAALGGDLYVSGDRRSQVVFDGVDSVVSEGDHVLRDFFEEWEQVR